MALEEAAAVDNKALAEMGAAVRELVDQVAVAMAVVVPEAEAMVVEGLGLAVGVAHVEAMVGGQARMWACVVAQRVAVELAMVVLVVGGRVEEVMAAVDWVRGNSAGVLLVTAASRVEMVVPLAHWQE